MWTGRHEFPPHASDRGLAEPPASREAHDTHAATEGTLVAVLARRVEDGHSLHRLQNQGFAAANKAAGLETHRRLLWRSIVAILPRTLEGGPPLSAEDVKLFTRRHGIPLPASYTEFLLATNGGRPERDLFAVPGLETNPLGRIHLFLGLNDPVTSCNLDWNLEAFGDRIPRHLLPIATTEGADKICLAISGAQRGAVFYWDGHARPGERNLYFLADDFTSFVSLLRADESSPRIS
jgi:hypothetical protein